MNRSPRRCTRVVVADEQPLFRDALARMIRREPSLELAAVAEGFDETRAAVVRHRPDVAVAAEALFEAALDPGGARLLVLADEEVPPDPYGALSAGAHACLSRTATAETMREAIAAVARGETVLDAAARVELAGAIRLRHRDDRPVLSRREREILVLIAQGRTAPQIAARLHLARATVKTHVLHLYEKLGVTERAAAVAEAMRQGLLE